MIIVVATEEEKALIPQWAHDRIIVTGVGIANVWAALADIPRSESIYNFGFAGSPDLPIGTICSIGKVMQHAENVSIKTREWDLGGDVPCYTDTDFVTESALAGCVFDMELVAICSMGFEYVRSIKTVSDNLSLTQYNEKTKKPMQ